MSSDGRRRRVERLLDVRKADVDKRSGELAAANERLRMAFEAHKAARDKGLHALAERDERAKRSVSIDDWMDAEQWLARLRELENAALQRLALAQRDVQEVRGRLAAAQREQDKIERLLLRIAERERLEQNRADQKTNDEAAAACFLKRREERA